MSTRTFHRRNLPHLFYDYGEYFITYCLKSNISVHERKHLSDWRDQFKNIDRILDNRSIGENYLLIPEIAEFCKERIHFHDNKDYKLICYCVMPNHVHLVFELLNRDKSVSALMHSIKRVSSYKSNIHLNHSGKFWQDESYDRLIRDEKELYFIIKYVLNNPVKAGLVEKWDEWKNTYCHPNYLVI